MNWPGALVVSLIVLSVFGYLALDLWVRYEKEHARRQPAPVTEMAIRSLNDGVMAVQHTLGINPHKGHRDVAARLEAIEKRIGASD